jgi:hypothetical protein
VNVFQWKIASSGDETRVGFHNDTPMPMATNVRGCFETGDKMNMLILGDKVILP